VRGRRLGRPGSRASGERGAALVEFVLILPVMLVLVMGLISGGIVMNHKLDLVSAAREGARYGITIPRDQCTPISKCSNKTWAQLVRSIVVARSDGDITDSQVCVALVIYNPGVVYGGSTGTDQASFTTNGTTRCYDDGNGDATLRVQVRINRPGDSINAVFFRIPVTLTTTATAKFEQ
jgi:Flp pilus assembly protein TadG